MSVNRKYNNISQPHWRKHNWFKYTNINNPKISTQVLIIKWILETGKRCIIKCLYKECCEFGNVEGKVLPSEPSGIYYSWCSNGKSIFTERLRYLLIIDSAK